MSNYEIRANTAKEFPRISQRHMSSRTVSESPFFVHILAFFSTIMCPSTSDLALNTKEVPDLSRRSRNHRSPPNFRAVGNRRGSRVIGNLKATSCT